MKKLGITLIPANMSDTAAVEEKMSSATIQEGDSTAKPATIYTSESR